MCQKSGSGVRVVASALLLLAPYALAGQREGSKDRISSAVRHQLNTLPFYTVFDYLNFHVDGNTVTLTGEVTRPTVSSDAEKAVRQVAGVSRVTNQIEVLPASAADGKLRLAEYLAVYGNYGLNQYQQQASPPIHIIVKNGAVTLEGAVMDQDDKTAAFAQASAVPGVVSLTNHLKVEP